MSLPVPAPAIALQLFLEDVRTGGTAPRKNSGGHHAVSRVQAGLAFISSHLGLQFDLCFVKFAVPAAESDGKVRPANDPLLLRDFAHAKLVAESSANEVIVFVALSVLVLFAGGVRFAHAQRSRSLEPVREGLVFHCKRGKSRQGGLAAPPFDWACPASSLLPQPLLNKYMTLRKKVVPNGCFLIPNLDPPRATLSTATGFRNSPMGDNAWRSVLRAFILGAPPEWPPRPPGAPGGRSTRRALATVAEILGLEHHERLPLGSWVEDISDSNKKFNKMPARYIANDTKLWSQFASKSAICDSLGDAIIKLPAGVFAGSSWDGQVAAFLRSTFAGKKSMGAVVKVDGPTAGEQVAGASSTSCSSSSRSSSSSMSSSAADAELKNTDFDNIEWILVRRSLHRRAPTLEHDPSPPRPMCCKITRTHIVGSGLLAAAAQAEHIDAQWCRRCAPDVRAFCANAGVFPFLGLGDFVSPSGGSVSPATTTTPAMSGLRPPLVA